MTMLSISLVAYFLVFLEKKKENATLMINNSNIDESILQNC